MAHRSTEVARRDDTAFGFSTDAIAELRECLGDSAETLIPELELLVREHLRPEAKAEREGWGGRGGRGSLLIQNGESLVYVQKQLGIRRFR